VKESISEEDLSPEIHIDSKLKFSEITPKFLRIMEQFAPFGPGNMRPVFLSEGVEVANTPRIVGTNHLVMSLKQAGCDRNFDAIGFKMGEYLNIVNSHSSLIDIVYNIDKNERDGRIFTQLKLKDIKLKENN
ncbi:MAG: single-stranded-DNA-specific exonuclease RecJ, partial [Ignavibacteriaceae bacterium]